MEILDFPGDGQFFKIYFGEGVKLRFLLNASTLEILFNKLT